MRHDMDLDQRLPTGETKRDALEKVFERTGKRPAELNGPELPPACERIYGIFHEMSAGRTFSMSGPAPLSNMDIFAWCSLAGQRLERWELQAIRRLDVAWIKAVNAANAEQKDGAEG
jgi:hypothetical protein